MSGAIPQLHLYAFMTWTLIYLSLYIFFFRSYFSCYHLATFNFIRFLVVIFCLSNLFLRNNFMTYFYKTMYTRS
jgi:hypothetical protein